MAQNLTVELDIDGAGSITTDQVDNGSSDACGIADFSLSQTDDCSHMRNTVTLTVTDVNGNQSTATATITVEDNEAPQPEAFDLDVYLDDAGNGFGDRPAGQCSMGQTVLWTASGSTSMTDCDDIGLNQIEITVLDVNGNQASALTDICGLRHGVS